MKKNLPFLLLATLAFITASVNPAKGQEIKTGKITVQIEEDGETVVDTVFDLKEGQDPQMIKEMISELTGEDVMIFSPKEGKVTALSFDKDGDDVIWHMKHSMTDHDSARVLHKDQMVMVYSSEEGTFTARGMEGHMHLAGKIGIDLDSLKEALGGGPVMVMKDKEGNITARKLEGDEDLAWASEDEQEDIEEIGVFITSGDDEDEDIYIIKTKDGKHIEVIKEEDVEVHETVGEEKQVKVIVTDEDGEKKVKIIKITVEEVKESGKEDDDN